MKITVTTDDGEILETLEGADHGFADADLIGDKWREALKNAETLASNATVCEATSMHARGKAGS